MRRPDLIKIMALLTLPVFLLTGCWQDSSTAYETLPDSSVSAAASSSAETADTLPDAFSLPYYPDETLDPIACPDGAQQTVAALLYEGLYELDETLTPQARLCSKAACSADGLTWSFTLRSGVVFSDGSALTAADAAASLTRAMTSDRYRARLSGVASVTAGDGAVTVALKTPDSGLPALLDIPIVKASSADANAPLGTGPYLLTSDSSGAFLAASGKWWNGGSLPLQTIRLVSCKDSDAVLYRFSSREVQLITADLAGTAPVSATGSVTYQDVDTPVLQYIGFNLRRPIFASAAVRQAMGLGIDRSSLVSACLSGHGKPAQFPVSPAAKLYPSSLEQSYSYTAYQTAMQAAGYGSGTSRKVTMIVNSENTFKVAAAQYAASALSGTGLEVTVKSLPWEEYLAALQSGSYDLYYAEVRLTADWNLSALLGTGGALNYGGYSDATADLLLSEFSVASDRTAAMSQLCSYLAKQAPILPICFKCAAVLSQSGVIGNLTPTAANPFYDIATCSFNLKK